ncbi:MAG: beta-ketoacyl synthase chain length factor [Steroidobacteraceae bacterium]|nr:beta-ketoacyl synthase chain length factor [Steroidobacteraceae bacterium]
MSTLTAYVNGVSFWAPRMPGWQIAAQVLRGEATAPEQPAPRPAPTLLGPTERRRAPDTVAIALEVAGRACESAGADPKELPSVFASTYGDLAISDYMSETLVRTPTLISPIRFHNSVHNAAAGYWTIGTGCYEPYTALTAFGDTFGEGLLEALVQAECGGRAVLLVAYDIEARGPLASMVSSRGIVGAGVVVSPRAQANSLARVRWRTGRGGERTVALDCNAEIVAGNAMAACLPFLETLARSERRTIGVGLSPALSLELAIDFPDAGGFDED